MECVFYLYGFTAFGSNIYLRILKLSRAHTSSSNSCSSNSSSSSSSNSSSNSSSISKKIRSSNSRATMNINNHNPNNDRTPLFRYLINDLYAIRLSLLLLLFTTTTTITTTTIANNTIENKINNTLQQHVCTDNNTVRSLYCFKMPSLCILMFRSLIVYNYNTHKTCENLYI
ncbi:hypothetical protein AGLY_014521 [Aphis glycines]|uniref:Uncharacterized protein n=1 Tax=Aphis glycines TaxID=307491 RepID=A0A6G0T5D3_APHGL|nr:hypothetical protein AGLY_014521 [Aphis glycines]